MRSRAALTELVPIAVPAAQRRKMGRQPWSSRLTVEQCHGLLISELNRGGLFCSAPGTVFTVMWNTRPSSEGVELTVSLLQRSHFEWLLSGVLSVAPATGDTLVSRINIPIVRTPCNFGGWRYWLLCPKVWTAG